MMGLAPYGSVDLDIVKNIDDYTKSWWERFDGGDDWRWVYRIFMNITGKILYSPQKDCADFMDMNFIYDNSDTFKSDGLEAQNVAATMQYIFEQTMFKFANKLYNDTKKIKWTGELKDNVAKLEKLNFTEKSIVKFENTNIS